MRKFLSLILILSGFLLADSTARAKDRDALVFTELHGADLEEYAPTAVDWRGHARLVAFWRSDCAPCLEEVSILPQIAKQNPDLPITLISLHDLEHTRAHLAPMPGNVRILVAQDDGREVLSAFGNDRMLALPYSVMLNAGGEVCDWYFGILAPEKIKEWRRKCL